MALGVAEIDSAIDLSAARRHSRADTLEIVIPATLLGLMVLACFFGPSLFHIAGPNAGQISQALEPPGSPGHIFGTDPLGNDVLSRCLFGGRASLEIGLGAVAIGVLIGATLGILSGYVGGITESVIMRCLDILLAFPALILALVVATYLGPSELHVMLAIAFFTIAANARIARATTLKIRGSEYLMAARFAGRPRRSILVEHVVVNAVQPLVTFALLGVAIVMLVESSLSYLGLGIPPPEPSWGNLIATGQPYLATDPGLVLVPAGFLLVTVLSLNVLGDALRARWAAV